jgi:hypothetical protein
MGVVTVEGAGLDLQDIVKIKPAASRKIRWYFIRFHYNIQVIDAVSHKITDATRSFNDSLTDMVQE